MVVVSLGLGPCLRHVMLVVEPGMVVEMMLIVPVRCLVVV